MITVEIEEEEQEEYEETEDISYAEYVKEYEKEMLGYNK
jgi:hypothetical protein